MIRICLTLALIIISISVFSQQNAYQRSVNAFEKRQTDSALFYAGKAIRQFKRSRKNDSLTLAYTHKADILWQEKGIQPALRVIDSALKLARKLPDSSLAAVAALNKAGQIRVHNMEAATLGKSLMLEALARIDPKRRPNATYAAFYNNIAWMYLELQDFEPAARFAEKSRALYTRLYGKNSKPLGSVYQTLCLITHDAGQFKLSEQYGKEMLRLAILNNGKDSPRVGLAHNDLGTLYESLHEFDKALYHRQEMMRIIRKDYERNHNPDLLAIAFNNLGNLYENAGEFYLADGYFTKALELHTLNFGAESPGIIRPLTHLANIKRELQRYKEADKLYRRAYNLQKKTGPDDALNLAYVETQYGDLFFDRGEFARAALMYGQALDHYRKTPGESTRIIESTRTTLGEAYAQLQRPNDALPLIRQSLMVYRRQYPKGNVVIAAQYNKLARARLLTNANREAARYSDSAFLEILQVKKLPGAAMVRRLPYEFQSINFVRTRAEILHRLYRQTKDVFYATKLMSMADDFGFYLEDCLPAIRTQTSLVRLSAESRGVYNEAIEICWLMYKRTDKIMYAEKAFAYSERCKALLLRLAANNTLVDVQQHADDAVARKDRRWRSRISSLNEQYLGAAEKKDSLLQLLSVSMEKYRAFQDSLRHKGSAEIRLKYNLKPAGINEVRNQLLDRQISLIEYAVTDSSVFAFLITAKTFRMLRKPVEVLRDIPMLQNLRQLRASRFINPAYRLYSSLIKPFQADFTGQKLLIVPDGLLYYLNFETLITRPALTGYRNLPYFIRNYELSSLLSASSAIRFREAGSLKRRPAMLMAPVFSDDMKQAYRKNVKDTLFFDPVYLTLLRQPFALSAARAISKYVRSDIYAGQSAEERVFKQSARDYGILHLGTHAEINNASPMYSRFFLAKPLNDSSSRDDGYLYAYEIYAMQLRAEMAVLTACETGNGTLNQGEGIMSLAHSFLYAGCPSVVMSLWKIDDKTSAAIITSFYKYLSEGDTKSEALRKAKLDYLNTAPPDLAQPYYWAGLTLIGDNGNMYSNNDWILWSAFGVMLIGLIFMVIRLRRLNP
ncbi:MAG: CHAT domain-containing protein [Mucilaginibacter polytrichastri]|nr:CHAT domain-containing protein [Mucilaginibacter polytrichastri]